MSDSNKIHTKCAKVEMNEEGIIILTLLPTENKFNLEEAKQQYEAALKLTGEDEKYLILVDTSNTFTQPSNEAQAFLLNIKERIAEAFVIKSLPYRILAKFYLKKSKNNPVKIFNSKEKAMDWLLKIKEKHYQL